jgi:hypothetical protein
MLLYFLPCREDNWQVFVVDTIVERRTNIVEGDLRPRVRYTVSGPL